MKNEASSFVTGITLALFIFSVALWAHILGVVVVQ